MTPRITSVKQRFRLIAYIIFLLLGIGYLAVKSSIDRLSDTYKRAEAVAITGRCAIELEASFWKLRFRENVLLNDSVKIGEKSFNDALLTVKQNLSRLKNMSGNSTYASSLEQTVSRVSSLLSQYENSFRYLLPAISKQNKNKKGFEAIYKEMLSAASFLKSKRLFIEALNLGRLQQDYLIQRSVEKYNEIKINLNDINEKTSDLASADNQNFVSLIEKYREVLENDYEAEKDIQIFKKYFDELSVQMSSIVAEITSGARHEYDSEIAGGEGIRINISISLLIFAAIIISLFAFLLYRMDYKIIRPIREVSDLIKRIRSGEMHVRFVSGETDELAGLGFAVNEMLDTIERNNKRLIGYQNELEKLVDSRTEELMDAVANLEREVVQRKSAEKEMETAKIKAEEGSRLKSEFLANMSHEIRTPMNAIMGIIQLLERNDLSKEQLNYLSLIKSSTDNLLVIINDILDFSKIEAGKLEISGNSTDLARIYFEMNSVFEAACRVKGLTYKSRFDERITGSVKTDEVRLRQILNNLLNNAAKFTDSGWMEFRIELANQTDMPDNNINMYFFSVEDTGIGISPENIEHIFQSFTQADGSVSRKFGGTGLGLAISDKLVRLLGGDGIKVESTPGKGSRFFFTLPLEGVSVERPKEEKPVQHIEFTDTHKAELSLSTMRVLVAEDNEMNRFILISVLKSLQIGEFVMTVNGEEVLERIKLSPDGFDVILMDVQMPKMDGLTASKQIREAGISVPIVALTAHAMDSDKEKCFNAGMDYYVSKPYRIPDLEKVLLSILEKKQSN